MQRYSDVVLITDGSRLRAVGGASVYVYLAGTSTLATLYEDNETSTKANPITASGEGEYAFKAANGTYDIVAIFGTSQDRTDGVVLFDPAEDRGLNIVAQGALAGVDCASALVSALAATTGTVIVPAGAFVATLTTSNSATILAGLNRIECIGTLALTLASGTHAFTSQVVVNSATAHRITITGATPVSTTASSQVSVSGSAKAYSVIIGVGSSSGVSVGDYALIYQDVTGTGDYQAHAGVWKVTAVDSGGSNRLTLLNTHNGAAFPTNTLTGGTVKVLKTILQFTGCDGFRFEGGQPLGSLDQVAIVGDYNLAAATGTTGCHGIITSSPNIANGGDSNATFNTGGFVTLGRTVGVSGFGEQGIAVSGRGMMVANNVASCANRKRGIYAEGGHIRCKFSICSGNGEDGYIADTTGFIAASLSIACGNGLNGYWSTNNSMLVAAQSVAAGNLASGFEARGATRLNADASTAKSNAASGFLATDGGNIDADAATASSNTGSGFYATVGAIIDANNSSSTSNGAYGYRSELNALINAAGSGSVSGNGTASYICQSNGTIYEIGSTLNPASREFGAVSVYNPLKANFAQLSVSSIGDATIAIDGTARLTLKQGAGAKINGSTPTSSAGELALGSTTSTTVGAAGAASALPANPTGYLLVGIGGTAYKIPYYAS